jgi:hypothetical protein
MVKAEITGFASEKGPLGGNPRPTIGKFNEVSKVQLTKQPRVSSVDRARTAQLADQRKPRNLPMLAPIPSKTGTRRIGQASGRRS